MEKNYFKGTERIRSPKETLEIIQPYKKQYGITRLANITGLDYIGIPVFTAIRPNSKGLSVSQGKGITQDAAKVSALMESIEQWHAENIDLERVIAPYTALVAEQENVVNLYQLPRRKNVCVDSITSKERVWVAGKDHATSKNIYVPYEITHCNTSDKLYPCHGDFFTDTNGLASGNNEDEAFLHGLYEVIERDSYACWSVMSASQKKSTKVKLDMSVTKYCQGILDTFKEASILVGVWEITSDLNISTFLVRIISEEPPPFKKIRPASGFGCHINKDIALSRALTEAAQSRLTFIAGARDDLKQSGYDDCNLTNNQHDLWKNSILATPNKAYKSINSLKTTNLEWDIKTVTEALSNKGLDKIIKVALSNTESAFSVIKTIVPGLEGAWDYSLMHMGDRAMRIKLKGALSA